MNESSSEIDLFLVLIFKHVCQIVWFFDAHQVSGDYFNLFAKIKNFNKNQESKFKY